MIPILYAATETAFTSNGKGRLTDIISCSVTEERNGVYELEFVYPVNGKLYDELLNGGIVACWHDDTHTVQPFDLYKRTAPLEGKVTFNARHIRYRQANIILKPFTGSSCSDTMSKIVTNSANTNPFAYSTDKATSGTFALDRPRSVQSLLMGEEGSILDVYGKGDYEFDRFNVILHANRGVDSGVTIRYGKNLAEMTDDYSEDGVFTAVAPYWTGNDTVVYPSEIIVTSPDAPAAVVPVTLDLSGAFQDKPTAAQLRTEARRQLNAAEPWLPTRNIKIDFVALWQTTEYANVAVLERLALCDTVSVIYEDLGVDVKQKVIKVVYDVLAERYSEMELGSTSETLGEAITQSLNKRLKQMSSISFMRDAVADATAQITGGLGGYVVLKLNAAGQPEELLIMDTPDTSTAVNVWRWNMGGLGHSSTGYNGPFSDIAITQDGKINANLIKAGILDGDIVKVRNLQIIDSNGNTISSWNSNGITLGKTTESHAFIDFNSLQLYDKSGENYLTLGDERDASGKADIDLFYEGDGTTRHFGLYPAANSSSYTVKVNGSTVTSGVTKGTSNISFDTAPAAGAEIEIIYQTESPVYHYDLGVRKQGSYVGPWSLAAGEETVASGNRATVAGGHRNEATAPNSFVGCGMDNKAKGQGSAVCGGHANTASGRCSHVGGGNGNTASGQYSHVGGGDGNTASGDYSFASGSSNTASGQWSTALGSHNNAAGNYQLVFGRYNVSDANKVEVVGIGQGTPQNGRTLDWSGNEWLAGGIDAARGIFRGNVDITGGYLRRTLPALSDDTQYNIVQIRDDGGNGRGGLYFFNASAYGHGTRLAAARPVNGAFINNNLTLYIDSNGNRSVAVTDQAAWRKGLGLIYQAGDSITMGTISSYPYVRWAGDWRSTTNLVFTIPLDKPCAGLTASITGSLIIICNETRTTINLSNMTTTCYTSPSGVTVSVTYSSAPSYAATGRLANVQPNGCTITFS